ncbi:MAG: thioredoxin family protein [Armatimonadetes bacterium]|nr:thioredoxin family protein [Armatimonadota bacterium]
MRRLTTAVAALVMCAAVWAADGITWGTDFEAALAEAKESKHLIMVDFWSNGCGRCRALEEEVFSEPEVAAFAENFIPVKINGMERDDLATRYMVARYPTVLFLTPWGRVLKQMSGYVQADRFVEIMHDALDAWETLRRATALVAELGDDTPTTAQALEIAREYSTANNYEQAVVWARKVTAAGDSDEYADALLILGKALVALDEPHEAVAPLKEFVTSFPQHEDILAGKLQLGYACLMIDQGDLGRPLLESIVKEAPETSSERAWALRLLDWLNQQG